MLGLIRVSKRGPRWYHQGRVLLTLLRHVARILANGSAAFFKAAMPLAEILATFRKNVSKTGPRANGINQ